MTSRVVRLKKLLAVQEQLKALHETRHAGFIAAANAARRDAEDLVERFDADGSLSGLFPAVYHRHIGEARARETASLAKAREEAARVATANARTNRVEEAYRDASRQDERERGDRERLDMIGQRLGQKLPK